MRALYEYYIASRDYKLSTHAQVKSMNNLHYFVIWAQ